MTAANESSPRASAHGARRHDGRRPAQSGVHKVPKKGRISRDPSWSGAKATITTSPGAPDLESTLLAQAPSWVPALSLRSDLIGAALLSAVAGYVDAAGFLALFGLFTAHVTGDLVAAGAVVAERLSIGVCVRLLMIPVFMLAVAAATLFARATRRRGQNPLTPLLALMTLALAAFCATGVTLRPMASEPDAWGVALIGGTGVIAMAIQNTLMRDALSSLSPTTIMTGNLTQFTIDLVEIVLPEREGDGAALRQVRTEALTRLVRFGVPLTGFMIGALLGAWLTAVSGLLSIALPTIAVGAFTFATRHGTGTPACAEDGTGGP